MKKIIGLIITLVIAVVAGQFTVQQIQESKPGAPFERDYRRVVKVFDGDTFQLDDGQKVRLIGIDTPESHQNLKLERDVKKSGKSKKILLAMGRKAAAFTETLLYGQRVRLEFDVERQDRYNRTLAYVYLEDGTFVNQKIIQEGYAYPMTIPPNVRYAQLFKQSFSEARNNNRGLWGTK